MRRIAPREETWREALFNRRMLICVFAGFSSGLPLYLLINLLPAWLRTEGVDLKAIGLFALIGLPYTWKFLWSPLLDRYALPLARPPPRLDARDAVALLRVDSASLGFLRSDSTTSGRSPTWRRRSRSSRRARTSRSTRSAARLLPDAELGLGNSIYVNAYRISSLVPGSLALILADRMPWSSVFLVTALFMLPGIAMTLVVREPRAPRRAADAARGGRRAVPRVHQRAGLAQALLVLLVHLPLQARRQHGDGARHAVLPRHGLHEDRDRRRRQERGPVGERRRAACWAACGW